jgi:hypothetical protein
LKGISSTIREWTWQFTKRSLWILLAQSCDDIYWRVISTIREGIWRFLKSFQSILFARSRDDISWMGDIHNKGI